MMVETFGGRTPAPGTIEMLEELSRVRPLSPGEVRMGLPGKPGRVRLNWDASLSSYELAA